MTRPGPNPEPVQRTEKPAEVEFHSVSKWYGHVIGVNNLSLRVDAGVTGLLGPNGAGKSTLLQLATGQLRPSQGEVRVLGHRPWNNAGLNRLVGLCPEQDAFFEWMTGREFLTSCALLAGLGRRDRATAAERVLELVRMTEHADRPVRGYSKGMRQRIKLAQALVHDPRVLFLDEPLTGTDPVARRELIDLILDLGRTGPDGSCLEPRPARSAGVHPADRAHEPGPARRFRRRPPGPRPDRCASPPDRAALPRRPGAAAKLVRWEDVLGVEARRDDGEIVIETRARPVLRPAAWLGPRGRYPDRRSLFRR